MLSVSIVLIAIVGTINIANYISTNQALDARLSLIADNGGTFPDMTPGDFGKKLEPKSDQPPAMNDLQKHGISQESPFDTRYFTVTIAPDGTVEYIQRSLTHLLVLLPRSRPQNEPQRSPAAEH